MDLAGLEEHSDNAQLPEAVELAWGSTLPELPASPAVKPLCMTSFGAKASADPQRHTVRSCAADGCNVRQIAADRAHVDERGAVGIRPEPAAATVRRHGGRTRRAPGRGRMWRVV